MRVAADVWVDPPRFGEWTTWTKRVAFSLALHLQKPWIAVLHLLPRIATLDGQVGHISLVGPDVFFQGMSREHGIMGQVGLGPSWSYFKKSGRLGMMVLTLTIISSDIMVRLLQSFAQSSYYQHSTMNNVATFHQRFFGANIRWKGFTVFTVFTYHEQFICYILMFLRPLILLANAWICALESLFALTKSKLGCCCFFTFSRLTSNLLVSDEIQVLTE